MSETEMASGQRGLKLLFLGSGGAIQSPAFFCACAVCEAARQDAKQRRTRASRALIGKEVVLIDASPDLESQLERESIRRVDRILITHWHFDHVAGLPALAEPASCAKWPPVGVYLPHEVMDHFDRELAYMKGTVRLHPIRPGDRLELPDAAWEVVKTTHTDESVGFIVGSTERFAYLVDGVIPPSETTARLKGVNLLILEATMDELVLKEGQWWMNFSLAEATDFWKQTGIRNCILTHLSCHSWKEGRLAAGMSFSERREYEAKIGGLKFAYDGMTMTL